MFNKNEKIEKMKIASNRVVSHFKSKNIKFSPIDDNLENVIFYNDKKTYKIAHQLFYRFSGISAITKEANNKIEIINITDEMFYNNIIIPIIENYFSKN